MAATIKLNRGLDIQLSGISEKVLMRTPPALSYAIKPADFPGLIPKLAVAIGDKVLAGDVIFYHKNNEKIKVVSPVSGIIKSIDRGEQRKILEVSIEPETEINYKSFTIIDINKANREDIIDKLLESGLWTLLRQRPFNQIANPAAMPKAIFISAFDTAPLAPDIEFTIKGQEPEFDAGIKVLTKLTAGMIHIGYNGVYNAPKSLEKLNGVKLHPIIGKHPAGNVGIQIHHIEPINKGDVVWTIHPQDVIIIGRFILKQQVDLTRIINIAGPMVKFPKYFRIISGATTEHLTYNNLYDGKLRYISGNPLTGTKISETGHLGYFDNQLTILEEGDNYEFLGWALPGLNKFSASRTFLSSLFPGKLFNINTNLNGGHRAYVLSGQYESVLPMNIYPVYLIKAILAGDIEKMENLGIYEVIEEDLALCEYVCTSKMEVMNILRKGIDMVIKDLH